MPLLPSPVVVLPTLGFPGRRRNPAPLFAALIVLALAAWPAIGYRNEHRQVTAMLAAPTCPAATECRLLVDTRIADVSHVAKATVIRINTPTEVAGKYRFDEGADVIQGIAAGDRITAEIWHGRVVALSDSGGRSITGGSPIVPEDQTLALAIALAAIALALLAKYALRATALAVVPPNPREQWRVDLRSPRSIAYNMTLFVAVSAVFGAMLQLADGGNVSPLIWMIILTPTIALCIVGNTLWGDRQARIAAGVNDPRSSRRRRIAGACGLLLLAATAMVVTFVAAFSYHSPDTPAARAKQVASAPVCEPGATVGCLRNQEVGLDYVDLSGDEPTVYISQSSLPPQWVFFSPDDAAFVDSLASDSQVIVTIYDNKIVAVSATDGSPVPTDWTDAGDAAPIGTVIGSALVTVALLVGAIALGWRRPGYARIVAALGLIVAALVGLNAGLGWSPYLLIPGFGLVCRPGFRGLSRRRTMSAAIPELLPTRRL